MTLTTHNASEKQLSVIQSNLSIQFSFLELFYHSNVILFPSQYIQITEGYLVNHLLDTVMKLH